MKYVVVVTMTYGHFPELVAVYGPFDSKLDAHAFATRSVAKDRSIHCEVAELSSILDLAGVSCPTS